MPSRSPSNSEPAAEAARLIDEGLALHRAGRLSEAAERYESVLAINAEHPAALHLQGVIALQSGAPQRALELIDRAIAADSGRGAYFNNRGNALRALDRHEDAVAAFRRALEIEPDLVDALNNLGATLRHLGKLEEAGETLEQALVRQPSNPGILNNLANVRDSLGEREEALRLWRRAVSIEPKHAESWRNMGRALQRDGDRDEALQCLRAAADADPRNADHWLQLGHVQRESGLLEEAFASYRTSCELSPASENLNALAVAFIDANRLDEAEEALNQARLKDRASGTPVANLGTVALKRGDYERALALYREAIAIDPKTHAGHNGQGVTLAILGEFKAALACFEEELRNYPNDAEARMNRGITLLTLGQFRDAWADYEHRLRRASITKASGPRWQGEALEDKTLLVFPEQGAGDNIQFIRYLNLVRARYPKARIVHPVQESLRRLFAGYLAGLNIEAPEGDEVEIHGYQISLMSLPSLFATTAATIPAQPSYLAVPAQMTEAWSKRLDSARGVKVGLAWGGNYDYAMDRERSVPFARLVPLLDTAGVAWVSLQKGQYAADAAGEIDAGRIRGDVSEARDFFDTACLISALDLVISVDTSIAHLAGAMGKPVWLLNRANTDWRWLLARSDSPWYPSMTIFRQSRRGNWDDVVAAIARALAERVRKADQAGAT